MAETRSAKQPYCFEVSGGELFAFAGIWERWKVEGSIPSALTIFSIGYRSRCFGCGRPALRKHTRYACLTAADFARLLSRTWSVVNPSPQTLQRQLGGGLAEIPGTGW